jgi:hypothetical protein
MDIEKFKKLEKDIFLAFIGIVIFTVIGFLLQVVPVSPGFKNAFYFILIIFVIVMTIDATFKLLEPFGADSLSDFIKEHLE